MGAYCCSCLCPDSSDRGVELSNNNRIYIKIDEKLKGDGVKIVDNGTKIEGNGSTFFIFIFFILILLPLYIYI